MTAPIFFTLSEVLIYILKLIKKYGKLLLVDVLIEIKDKIKLIKIIIK